MKKRLIATILIGILMTTPARADEAELLARIEALEQRVEQLEQMLGIGDQTAETQAQIAVTGEAIKLAAGTWVVGEDFPAGKYKLTCTEGHGPVYFYNSLAQMQKEKYDYIYDYFMGSQEENEEKYKLYSIKNYYTVEVNNVRLENGNCVYTEATEITFTPVP